MRHLARQTKTLVKDTIAKVEERERKRRAQAIADECIRASIAEGLIDARDFDIVSAVYTPISMWEFEERMGVE